MLSKNGDILADDIGAFGHVFVRTFTDVNNLAVRIDENGNIEEIVHQFIQDASAGMHVFFFVR